MGGLKKFVSQGMQTDVETIEARVKRLKSAALPDVIHTSLDLYYNDLKDDERQQAYTARLELWLSDNIHYRTVHARCASFDEALTEIQEYEACLIAGKRTDGFEVYNGKKRYEEELSDEPDTNGPFETRAEFTTWTDVLGKHTRADKKGEFTHDPRTVADLPRLNHGMAVVVPLSIKDGTIRWYIDWFDYACYKKDTKDVKFVCIHDEHEGIFPLDPYISDALNHGRQVPQAYTLWLKKTIGDIKATLKNNEVYR